VANSAGVFLEMQHDFAAAGFFGGVVDGVAGAAVAGPDEVLAVVAPGVGVDLDFVGDHEGGVKTYAELTDEGGIVLLAGVLEGGCKGFGAGVGDGAEVFNEFGAGHADAVIGNGEGACGFIGGDGDFQRGGGVKDVVFRELGKAHLFHRVSSVGHELANEDLAVGVEAVDDDIEDLFDFGLEFVGLAHGCVVFSWVWGWRE